ncbi:MAG: hypothetical protein ACRDWY_17000, partial [Actinomycetes bacterium]
PGRGPRHGRRWAAGGRWFAERWRSLAAVLLTGTAVTMAAVTGLAWAGAGEGSRPAGVADRSGGPVSSQRPASATPRAPSPSASSTPSVVTSRWAGILQQLDEARSRAFASGAASDLEEVYVAGSPALRRDRATLGRLTRSGLRAEGLRLVATRVTVVDRRRSAVRVEVVDRMPPYRLVDASSALVERRPGRGPTRWTVTLQEMEGTWLVYDVARG